VLWTVSEAEEIYSAAAAAGARPDPLLTISQWADRYRWLSQRASAEHGRWRTERTPYLREIMDCLSPSSHVERTVFMKGAQIGGTECGNNWMGYIIHQAPGPMMSVQPTVEMAKRNSKQRIDPLIEKSEVLRKLLTKPVAASNLEYHDDALAITFSLQKTEIDFVRLEVP
jgi:phage terminase large subunit GpA-like protein